jgi:hypothetical protein
MTMRDCLESLPNAGVTGRDQSHGLLSRNPVRFVGMPRAALLLCGVVATLSLHACHGPGCVERTSPIVNYWQLNEFCDLAFFDPRIADVTRIARYQILPSGPDRGPDVCGTKKYDVVECETQQGPTPSYCVRGNGCIQIGFLGPQAFALESFLGTDIYALSVDCDGIGETEVHPSLLGDAGPGSGDWDLEISCSVPL